MDMLTTIFILLEKPCIEKRLENFSYMEKAELTAYMEEISECHEAAEKRSSLFHKMKQKIGQKNIWMQRNTLRFLAEMKSFLRYSLRLRNLHNSLVLMKMNIIVSQSIFNLKRY